MSCTATCCAARCSSDHRPPPARGLEAGLTHRPGLAQGLPGLGVGQALDGGPQGLAILATNRKRDLDEAFLRRLRFVVDFPLPGVAERLRIWRGVIPDGVDATALDFDFLASRFPLAGGHIRAIVFHACLQCAEAGAPRALTMHAIIRAVQREYEKLERASSLEQFGPYAPLVASERSVR